jgi:hypothetical protein
MELLRYFFKPFPCIARKDNIYCFSQEADTLELECLVSWAQEVFLSLFDSTTWQDQSPDHYLKSIFYIWGRRSLFGVSTFHTDQQVGHWNMKSLCRFQPRLFTACAALRLSWSICSTVSFSASHLRVSWGSSVSMYSVWLQSGWAGFDPRQRQRIFFSSFCVQTSSEDHSDSYPMATGCPFPGVKSGLGVILTIHPHLVPISRISKSYSSSPP